MLKRAAKRPATLFDSAADAALPSKRVMDAPSFDVHRAESSHQQLMAGPPLDPQRAQSAHQHVRALNTQFASWVQLQLQNHPDELWEDGVRDYLSHASSIMDKFKDVVDWLRVNTAKQDGISCAGSTSGQQNPVDKPELSEQTSYPNVSNGFAKQTATASLSNLKNSGSQNLNPLSITKQPPLKGITDDQKKSGAVSESNKTSLLPDVNNGAAKQPAPSLFSSFQNMGSQSSGLVSFSQKPAFLGSQLELTPKVEASRDVDDEDDTPKPSSPSLEKAKELGVIVVHEAKCKVYIKPDNPPDNGWNDMGVGQLSIKCKEGAEKATRDSKPTIIIRNDVGKILLNALIYPGIKMNIQKNTIASIFHTSGAGQGNEAGNGAVVARMYLIKMKNNEETTKLAAAIKDYAPSE